MTKNKLIIIIIIIVNILGLIIPYSIKNYKLKENIMVLTKSKQNTSFIFKEKSVDYKSLETIQEIAKESGIENIKIETNISDEFGINIKFNGDFETSSKLIANIYKQDKNISIQEAKLNFDINEESYLKFIIRGK